MTPRQKFWKIFSRVCAALVLAAAVFAYAVRRASSPQPAPQQETQSVLPSQPAPVILPAGPTPTPASPDAPPSSLVTFVLGSGVYRDTGGLFQLPLPEGWEISAETAGWVRFSAAQGSLVTEARVTNAGVRLDGTSFENFIAAREASLFSADEQSEETARTIDSQAQRAVVEKSLFLDGKRCSVTSYYRGLDGAVLSVDVWLGEGQTAWSTGIGMEWIDQIRVDPQVAQGLEIYAETADFSDPQGAFHLRAPVSWTRQVTRRDGATAYTFLSPDQHASLQVLRYEYGTPLTQSQAGSFALILLPDLYAPDLVILSDKTRSDNTEYLTWKSSAGGYEGTSFFSSQGAVFLLFTTMMDSAYTAQYAQALSTLSSEFEPVIPVTG